MERRLAAILAADVVGYSRLMGADEAGTLATLKAHRLELWDPTIKHYGGRIVGTAGDSLMIEFASAVAAVECAMAVQRGMVERNADLADDRRMRFRIGINIGEVIVDSDDIYGDGVNIAARLEALAEPGGLAVSENVREQVMGKIAAQFVDAGSHEVKNIARPIRVWRWPGEAHVAPPPVASHEPLPLPDKPSIAVLPFDNISGDPEQEIFADGMTEDIITALSQVRWLFVIARNSTFAYKGTSPDIRRLARDLGVRYVLEGSIRKSGNRIRISAQLIDAETGHHVWADRYDRDLGDIFALQDEMTETLIAALEPELSSAERERAIRRPPETLDAWSSYQRGMWHHYRFTKEDNAKAREMFRQAIRFDPNFSRALGALAHTGYWDALFGFTDTPEKTLAEALALARKAISLDDKEPFAHFALGRVETLRGELETAIDELEQAIRLNPSFAHAHYGLGWALILAGRPEMAVESIDRAIRLNPHDPSIWTFMGGRALALIMMHHYEDAVAWALKSSRQANAGWLIHAITAVALAHLGSLHEARKALADAVRLKPDLSSAFFQKVWPFKNPADLEHFVDGLRKAGLTT